MRRPQVLVFESDGRLAALLRGLAEECGWSLHEVRQLDTCWRRLEKHERSTVLVLRTGRDLEKEYSLLEQVGRQYPETQVVVVTESDHPLLLGLAWDLGARYVLKTDSITLLRERLLELTQTMLAQSQEKGR